MRDFMEGFLHGVRVSPVAYFAPLIAIWRLLLQTTVELLGEATMPSPQTRGLP